MAFLIMGPLVLAGGIFLLVMIAWLKEGRWHMPSTGEALARVGYPLEPGDWVGLQSLPAPVSLICLSFAAIILLAILGNR